MRHRVILVREWDAQVSGSGCCGRLGGIAHRLGEGDTFAYNRRGMEAMGTIYRALGAELEDSVDIQIVDPRNTLWLIPAVIADGWRRGLSIAAIGRHLRGVACHAIVVDGRTLYSNDIPPLPEALAAIRTALQTDTTGDVPHVG